MQGLNDWAQNNGITLFVSPSDPTVYSFYISEGSETLQLAMQGQGEVTRVDIWSVETFDDQEVHFKEVIENSNFCRELDQLVDRVRSWFKTRQL